MILTGTAQHGMLQNMGYAGIIKRRRTEANGKYLVVILIGKI